MNVQEPGRMQSSEPRSRLRILAVADMWQGSNAYAYVRAFRRLGHSVRVVPPENFIPGGWRSKSLRGLRRLLEPALVREYSEALVAEARNLRPHLFFVFKGRYVTAGTIRTIKQAGAVAINFFPDNSVWAHGQHIPRALPEYDWIFTTKSFGLADMESSLGIRHASFLPHSYDPEVHRPVELGREERAEYNCEVSFVGTWSPKKQRVLEKVCAARGSVKLRIWGGQWEHAGPSLAGRIEGRGVFGLEYAKALVGSDINLCILSEARAGASSGDLITSRTFHIPATGAFMLHERTPELLAHFEEGKECGSFGDEDELVEKIDYYLARPAEREAVARAGYARSVASGYCVDARAARCLEKMSEIRSPGAEICTP
jgi:spore maturation protein CgeB